MRLSQLCLVLLILVVGACLLAGCAGEAPKGAAGPERAADRPRSAAGGPQSAATEIDADREEAAADYLPPGPSQAATEPGEKPRAPRVSVKSPRMQTAAKHVDVQPTYVGKGGPTAAPTLDREEPTYMRLEDQPGPGGATPQPAPAARGPAEPIAQPLAATAKAGAPDTSAQPQQGYEVVEVFYGTDRAVVAPGEPEKATMLWWLGATAITGLVMGGVAVVALHSSQKRRKPYWIVVALVVPLLPGAVAAHAALAYIRATHGVSASELAYGPDRGDKLRLGTCQVSIPKGHQRGEVERPKIWLLEVCEDPERHITMLNVTPQAEEEFYAQLRNRVGGSEKQAAFVFVHGFNVSFQDAAYRTAQMAYDLQYDGAPIFYSWPSRGGVLPYSVDEANIDWTVPHLEEFLLGIAQRSGARQVHLIAHSMGNRALTSALRDFSFLPQESRPIFREVVLAAPDIDADVFKNNIAPAIVKTAERTTLYASSKDRALYASKQVHGYPRAGEAGEGLVVLPNIDTVDASTVDTSLLGHSYLGDSSTVLADLAELLERSSPPDRRTWLRPRDRGPLRYWVFQGD